MGYPNHPVNDEAIVILMDPDQIILRPFRNNDFSNTNWRFAKQDKARTTIQHGYPMGQLYGFGLQWRNKVKMEDIAPYDLPSPVDQLTGQQARDGFIAGYVSERWIDRTHRPPRTHGRPQTTLHCHSSRHVQNIIHLERLRGESA